MGIYTQLRLMPVASAAGMANEDLFFVSVSGIDSKLSVAEAKLLFGLGGVGVTPLATDLAAGTVKTNTFSANPIVYLKSEVDTLFYTKTQSDATFATLAGLAGKAALAHTHAAADVTSGVLATARLGSGTADNTKFLRGDSTWQVPAGGSGGTVPNGGTLNQILTKLSNTDQDTGWQTFTTTPPNIPAGQFQAGQYVYPGRLRIGLPTDATVIANPPRAGYSIELFGGVGSGDANIFLCANQSSESPQWSGNAHYGVVGMSADGGVRMVTNGYNRLSDGAWTNLETDRPRAITGLDSAGALSYSWEQPSALGVGPYSATPSQTFVIYGSGYGSVGYAEGIPVDLMTMQGGRYMRFRTCAVTNTPLPVIEFQADQTIWWYQKMISPTGSATRAPLRIRSGVAPTAPEAGDVWMESTGLFLCRPSDLVVIGPLT